MNRFPHYHMCSRSLCHDDSLHLLAFSDPGQSIYWALHQIERSSLYQAPAGSPYSAIPEIRRTGSFHSFKRFFCCLFTFISYCFSYCFPYSFLYAVRSCWAEAAICLRERPLNARLYARQMLGWYLEPGLVAKGRQLLYPGRDVVSDSAHYY